MKRAGRIRLRRRTPLVLRPYTTIRCPLARHLVGCRMLCTPRRGHGVCGRLAPHLLKGKTQRAIEKFERRRREERRLTNDA